MHALHQHYTSQTIRGMSRWPEGPRFESGGVPAWKQMRGALSIPQHRLVKVPLNNVRWPTTQVLGISQVYNKSKTLQ